MTTPRPAYLVRSLVSALVALLVLAVLAAPDVNAREKKTKAEAEAVKAKEEKAKTRAKEEKGTAEERKAKAEERRAKAEEEAAAKGEVTVIKDEAALLVVLNKAEVKTLCLIPGVGKATAERIVAARPVEALDDLLKVEGIAAKRLGQIKGAVGKTKVPAALFADEAAEE